MRPFKLGKIAGFEVNIDWSWLIIFFLVLYSLSAYFFPLRYPGLSASSYWIMGAITTILFFSSLLAHELMHSVVARGYGIGVKGITLYIFGGMSQTASEPKTPKIEFYMAAVGPATSLALGGIFYAVAAGGQAAGWPVYILGVARYLGFINILLGVFNLVPGFPLDGGRVLRSALWSTTGDFEKATRYASYAGQGFGYSLMAIGILIILIVPGGIITGLWFAFIGWYLSGIARSSYEQVVVKEALSGVEVERVMNTDVPTVLPDVTVEDFVDNYLLRHQYACYPVVENDQVRGIVSLDEVRSVPKDKWSSTTVSEITHPVEDEIKVRKQDDAWDALLKLATSDTTRLLVMEDSTLDGTVTQENILRLVRAKMRLDM